MAILHNLALISSLTAATGPNATFTRAGQQLYQNDANIWQLNASANTPCYSARGILLEPGRTNYCTNSNLAQSSSVANMSIGGSQVVTVVSDSAR